MVLGSVLERDIEDGCVDRRTYFGDVVYIAKMPEYFTRHVMRLPVELFSI